MAYNSPGKRGDEERARVDKILHRAGGGRVKDANDTSIHITVNAQPKDGQMAPDAMAPPPAPPPAMPMVPPPAMDMGSPGGGAGLGLGGMGGPGTGPGPIAMKKGGRVPTSEQRDANNSGTDGWPIRSKQKKDGGGVSATKNNDGKVPPPTPSPHRGLSTASRTAGPIAKDGASDKERRDFKRGGSVRIPADQDDGGAGSGVGRLKKAQEQRAR